LGQSGRGTINIRHGNVEPTGRFTDLLINGWSFFQLTNGDQTIYTRNGRFTLDDERRLVQVRDGVNWLLTPEVRISEEVQPLETSVIDPETGTFRVLTPSDGELDDYGLGTLTLFRFRSPSELGRGDADALLMTDKSGLPEPILVRENLDLLRIGAVERSNVTLDEEERELVHLERLFELQHRASRLPHTGARQPVDEPRSLLPALSSKP